jgi:hypothetical protein
LLKTSEGGEKDPFATHEAGEEVEGVEREVGQELWAGVSDFRLQSEAGFSRLPEGCRRTREGQARRLLAAQVSFNVCNPLSVGRRRSTHSTAVAGALGFGVDDAVFETL